MSAVQEGWKLLETRDYDRAILAFDRALTREPGSLVRARVGRAIALRLLGRADEAVAELNAAVAADTRSALAYHERGATLAILGRDREALRDLNQAIAL